MPVSFIKAAQWSLRHEGGYVNHPSDPGGETNFGISKRHYPDLDIKNLTQKQALEIYERDYWQPSKAGEINHQKVAAKYFDLCLNMGQINACKALQMTVNFFLPRELEVDGMVGPLTISGINRVIESNRSDIGAIVMVMAGMQISHYMRIIQVNPSLARFSLGWAARAKSEPPG